MRQPFPDNPFLSGPTAPSGIECDAPDLIVEGEVFSMNTICDTILDETSSPEALREALDAFVQLCSKVTNIRPDPSFDAWAEDSLLDNGVAINSQAAAHCALDYQRSVVFIRGVHAAINALRLEVFDEPIEILYAGCGPFATLLLPLLGKYSAGDIKLHLLDFHQRSLDSVELLLTHFGYAAHAVQTIRGDACKYKHTGQLHMVVAETMQKSLEQEPQFAVTANLAPQLCPMGVFIPQRIDVALCLSDLEQATRRFPLATVCTLLPELAFEQMQLARIHSGDNGLQLEPTIVEIPRLTDIARFDAALFTRICVFEQYWLKEYESQITLPLKCYEILPLAGGECYRVSYQLGSYPKFNFELLTETRP